MNSRYTKDADVPDDDTYLADLKRFVTLTEKQPDTAKMFGEYYLLQAENESESWYRHIFDHRLRTVNARQLRRWLEVIRGRVAHAMLGVAFLFASSRGAPTRASN